MGVLDGIRVIDVTMFAFGPVAGGVLAHWGADVIKVENTGACDPMRLLFGGTTEPGGAYMSFKNYNRGKRAVAIDLATEDGRSILYRLVDNADVFLTSHLPATRKKLKIDVDDIRQRNPRIIYAKGSGHGPRGPESERRAYDAATWWARGSLADSAMQVSGAEWPTGMVGHGDTISGTVLAGGICAALLQRERTGVASVVDGSLLGTAIWYNHQPIVASGLGIQWGGAPGPREERLPTSNAYRTKDGRFISLVFVNDPDVDWVDLCAHLGHPGLATDPRFATTSARSAHRADAVRALDEIFARRTFEEWKQVLVTARGVWAPVQTPTEIHDDPQTVANGFLREVHYPNGSISLPVPPVLFDEEGGDIQRAPDYCEHTDEVLRETGMSTEEIARYRRAGVVA
ncbi:MAG TPA: CoA transferase [Acidimicrobiales bacterium]|nr:CoA transferase [Acidimicrobiales bacterium]